MEVPPGESRTLAHNGEEVALFHVEGCLYAVGNKCPHRGGPLSRGRVEATPQGPAVRCPIHGWLFELASGRCLNQPQARVNAYSVSSRDGEVSLAPLP